MLKKLRLKFVCINMLIVTVMLAVILGTVVYFTRNSLEQQSLQMMMAVSTAPTHIDRPGTQGPQARFPYFILTLDEDGQLRQAVSSYYDLSDREFLVELLNLAAESKGSSGVLREYELRFLRARGPWGTRIVFADISTENDILSDLLKSCCAIAAGSFLVFLLISLWLARWAVKPVDRAWQQQRQFVADASHELKTPLTVIMTNAELLQDPAYDDESRSHFTRNILTMSAQMRRLVEGLLDLARLDSGGSAIAFTPVDFSTLISDTLLPFEPLFFEQGLFLDSTVDENIRLDGSENHLRQVVEILLDNAMKYTTSNTTVRVRLKRHGLHCLLSVSNEGPPIPPEELAEIFKRFYRADKARSRNGSYGLGLSIAEGIVTRHHGRIWPESRGGINTFFVQLPL